MTQKIEEQLNSFKCRANQISNEDCVCDEKSNDDYWVHSQNKDTHDIWYSVIFVAISIWKFTWEW